jgi:hypothetical protein
MSDVQETIDMKFVVLLALTTLVVHASARAQQEAGFVIESEGDWFLSNPVNKQIHKGSSLPAGAIIVVRQPVSAATHIIVGDLTGKVILSKYCDIADDCAKPLKLTSASGQEPSFASKLFKSLTDLLEPTLKFEVFGSRSQGDPRLIEAVILLKADEVDLTPVFSGATPGNYSVKFSPALVSRQASPKALLYVWNPSQPRLASVQGLRTGLYIVQAQDQRIDGPLAATLEAWVLVSSPEDYKQLAACYALGADLIQSWEKQGVSENVIRSFCRAYLQCLLSKANPCPPKTN